MNLLLFQLLCVRVHFSPTIAFNYNHDFNKDKTNQDFISTEISSLTFHANDAFEMEFLPNSILYSIDSKNISIIY